MSPDPLGILSEIKKVTVNRSKTEIDLIVDRWYFCMRGVGSWIPLQDFCDTPIPYIESLIERINKTNEEEKRAYEEAKRRNR